MFKEKIALVSFLLVLANAVFANENFDLVAKELLSKLVTLENETIKTYEGFEMNTIIIKNQPMISAIYEQVDETDKKNPIINNKSVLFVMPNVSSKERKDTMKTINAMKNFKPIILIQEKNDDEDDFNNNEIVEFKFLDNRGVTRVIEWRDRKTGFSQKTGYFDENGHLLSFRFYINLKINARFPAENIEKFKNKTISLPNFINKYGNFDINNVTGFGKYLKYALAKEID